MDRENYWKKGILPISIASFLWGFYCFFSKIASSTISPIQLIFFISVFAVVVLAIPGRVHLLSVRKAFQKYPWHYIFLSLTGIVIGDTLFFVGLERLDLGVAILLEKLQPVFVIVLASIFLKERQPFLKLCYAGLAVVSSYFVVVPDPFRLSFSNSEIGGILAILGTALFWAISSIIGKNVMNRRAEPRGVTFLRYFLGALMLLPIVLIMDFPKINAMLFLNTGGLIMLIAVLGLTGFILYYRGLFHVPVSITVFLELITPLVSIVLGVVFLGEHMSLSQVLAVPVLLFSVVKIALPSGEPGG